MAGRTQRTGSGDEAFRRFVVARWTPLLRVARVVTANEETAVDLLAQVLASLHREWDRVEHDEDPQAWVRRALVSRAVGTERRRRLGGWRPARAATAPGPPYERTSTPFPPAGEGPADDDAAAHERAEQAQRERLWSGLAGLPVRQRVALSLPETPEFDEHDAAAALDFSPQRLARTRGRAEEALRRWMSEPP